MHCPSASEKVDTTIIYARTDSPVGPVWVATTETGICAVRLGAGQPRGLLAWLSGRIDSQGEPPREAPEALAPALGQLCEYFFRTRREFDLPLDLRGTPFQRAVWEKVARIPYGTTTTYGEIARCIARPKAARAVGGANGANPLPIIIPCHRVIGARGALTGYGAGLTIKAKLLKLEGALLV